MKTIKIPELALVALIGPSGSGKSTFAKQHFLPTEVISSDYCRGLVSDDENSQSCSKDAFDVLYYIAEKRLAAGKLTVIDATNVRQEDREQLLNLAYRYHVQVCAIVFNLSELVFHERNAARPDRGFGPHVIRHQTGAMRRSIRHLSKDGFRYVTVLHTEEEVNNATIKRVKLWNNRRDEHGPFDIIGDVHGCYDELLTLLNELGYQVNDAVTPPTILAPEGRRVVFLGDLVDRGPKTPQVLQLAMAMTQAGCAICVPGNHDVKLWRYLQGKNVKLTHGLEETVEQLSLYSEGFRSQVADFIDAQVGHYVLDDGRLVVAHAGLKEEMQGRASGAVRSFALFGETTGETDEFDLPVRYNWAKDYRGEAMVVYGHTPTPEAEWLNRTICIDTGCVFGGKLTALRYPERKLVSVPALQTYYEPIKPLEKAHATASDLNRGFAIDLEDVLGKLYIKPRLGSSIVVRENQGRAALEVMSRFALDPRWLVYLPPTMAPSKTSDKEGYLEYPAEAFRYYREAGIKEVVCEEKHMGSRAVIVLCRDEAVAGRRFGISGYGRGVIYTRTGRSFFNHDSPFTECLLTGIDQAMQKSGLWEKLQTDWIMLDAEILPWSAKAAELLKAQYIPTGTVAKAFVQSAKDCLQNAVEGESLAAITALINEREVEIAQYIQEYQNYCWPVNDFEDIRIAPFQILAYEGQAALDEGHRWHLEMLDLLSDADPQLFKKTERCYVSLDDEESEKVATQWWEKLTTEGQREGMVIKPVQGIAKNSEGKLLQPAIKCRGRNYLRIIYGPTYTEPDNLDRLRVRGLGKKYSFAMKEFVLGHEAIHRFIEREPLYKIHECVFAVLALESDPIDPRL